MYETVLLPIQALKPSLFYTDTDRTHLIENLLFFLYFCGRGKEFSTSFTRNYLQMSLWLENEYTNCYKTSIMNEYFDMLHRFEDQEKGIAVGEEGYYYFGLSQRATKKNIRNLIRFMPDRDPRSFLGVTTNTETLYMHACGQQALGAIRDLHDLLRRHNADIHFRSRYLENTRKRQQEPQRAEWLKECQSAREAQRVDQVEASQKLERKVAILLSSTFLEI